MHFRALPSRTCFLRRGVRGTRRHMSRDRTAGRCTEDAQKRNGCHAPARGTVCLVCKRNLSAPLHSSPHAHLRPALRPPFHTSAGSCVRPPLVPREPAKHSAATPLLSFPSGSMSRPSIAKSVAPSMRAGLRDWLAQREQRLHIAQTSEPSDAAIARLCPSPIANDRDTEQPLSASSASSLPPTNPSRRNSAPHPSGRARTQTTAPAEPSLRRDAPLTQCTFVHNPSHTSLTAE